MNTQQRRSEIRRSLFWLGQAALNENLDETFIKREAERLTGLIGWRPVQRATVSPEAADITRGYVRGQYRQFEYDHDTQVGQVTLLEVEVGELVTMGIADKIRNPETRMSHCGKFAYLAGIDVAIFLTHKHDVKIASLPMYWDQPLPIYRAPTI
jgi:hypothetical protein